MSFIEKEDSVTAQTVTISTEKRSGANLFFVCKPSDRKLELMHRLPIQT
jgi:hypothetical protein